MSVYELDEIEHGDIIQEVLLINTGQRTVPNVFVNGRHLGGNDDTIQALQSGELHTMLGIKDTK